MTLQASILGMFARSPIRPLQKHMAKAHTCCELLLPFFDALLKDDWDEAESIQMQIGETEHEADILKMDFRLHLPKKLFLPVPRTDLLNLLSAQELIANTSKDIAGIILGRKMKIPSHLADSFMRYLKCSIAASRQAKTAISELDELLESGFGGKEARLVAELIQKLNEIENDSDDIQIQIRKELFAIEKELQAVDVMFLYKVIEWVGLLADSAQKAGNQLRILSAE